MHEIDWESVVMFGGFFACACLAVWTRFLGERERLRTLRAFAESGQPFDAELIKKIFLTSPGKERSAQGRGVRGLTVGGSITLFVGVALLISVQLVGHKNSGEITGALVTSGVGLGLLLAAFLVHRLERANGAGSSSQVVTGSDSQ